MREVRQLSGGGFEIFDHETNVVLCCSSSWSFIATYIKQNPGLYHIPKTLEF